ncbi:ABC transporter permease [Myxococcus sp. K15C18031901]|uniref:ABC transporter permease n=1 Tax=Myxococcus dinghuensis TaxID=2906761 RepID=UPI0020A7651B|nr:ABC transporter permease [Myxococcus dinghuensis]MCP3100235.1 ABC transporter permease [Myxococcus dinghuensis]
MSLAQDFRLALRKLRGSPGFTLVAVLTLALGVGANSAIFSVVDAVLLRPLPMDDAERLVRLYSPEGEAKEMPTSSPDFMDFQERSRSFSGMTAVRHHQQSLGSPGVEPERLSGAWTTPGFFEVLGAPVRLGRGLTPADSQPGAERVIVLSHGLWQRRFDADPGILGRTVQLGGENRTVVGVGREGFDFPQGSQLWAPVVIDADFSSEDSRGAHGWRTYARLRPGVTLEAAYADVVAVARQLEAEHPTTNTGVSASLVPLRDALVGNVRPALFVLLGAVGLVLLIACANLSNLLLARAVGRRGELSVRMALGASRGQVVRQLLVESGVLAGLGALLGMLFAGWLLDVLLALAPRNIPGLERVSIDGRVLLFTCALGLFTALLFGLLPALQASRENPATSLREVGAKGSTRGGGRARHVLIVAETALAVVLLVGGGLLLKSFQKLKDSDPGFRADGVLSFELELPESTYPWAGPATEQFYATLLERLGALPGVEAVGAVQGLPLSGSNMTSGLRDLALPEPALGEGWLSQVHIVTPGYAQTLRMRLVRGRLLEAGDSAAPGHRAVVISEEAARRYWPGEDPLGREVEISASYGKGRFGGRVVGIVGDVRHEGIEKDAFPQVYVPFAQALGSRMTVVLRTQDDPLRLAGQVREEVKALDSSLPLGNVRTLEALVGGALAQPRFFMLVTTSFAVLALLLAAVGLSGVIAHAVSHRTREFGIRMALGARTGELMLLVMRQYLRLTSYGLVIGLVLALGVSRMLTGMVYGIVPSDPLTYLGVAALLGAVALVASYVPALRVARVDPIVALRQE